MKLTHAILLASTLFAGLAHASTPSDSSVNRLLEVAPYEDIFNSVTFSGLEYSGEQLAYELANNSKLTDKQRADALKVYETYANNLIKEVNTPAKKTELKKAYTNAVKQTYTQDEVDALLAFLDNKVLQQALQKERQVMEAYLGSVEKSTVATIEKYNKAHLTKTQDSIKRITNQ